MAPRRATGCFFILAVGISLVLGFRERDLLLREWLLFRLHSPDPEARRAAASRLGRHGSPRAVRGLIALLESEAVQGVRDEASLALGEIGPAIGPAGVAALLEEMEARAERFLT
jgi:HEAT repeat protein